MKRLRPVTDRQREVLGFIRGYIAEHGYAPSTQNIAEHFRLSKNAAVCHVDRLIEKGLLRRDPHVARSLVVVEVPA